MEPFLQVGFCFARFGFPLGPSTPPFRLHNLDLGYSLGFTFVLAGLGRLVSIGFLPIVLKLSEVRF